MAEDALPKDERRQTMKRIIAILLALIMIFAFAACKGKDDKNDTTAESSQDANADVQDTQTGAAESNAAESTADDSTAVAPSEGGSEAATQGQQGGSQGGQQGNKPAAEIKAPVNGSKAEIVAFFNKYASAMKSYTGKVSVKRVQGTTSKINSITGYSEHRSAPASQRLSADRNADLQRRQGCRRHNSCELPARIKARCLQSQPRRR